MTCLNQLPIRSRRSTSVVGGEERLRQASMHAQYKEKANVVNTDSWFSDLRPEDDISEASGPRYSFQRSLLSSPVQETDEEMVPETCNSQSTGTIQEAMERLTTVDGSHELENALSKAPQALRRMSEDDDDDAMDDDGAQFIYGTGSAISQTGGEAEQQSSSVGNVDAI